MVQVGFFVPAFCYGVDTRVPIGASRPAGNCSCFRRSSAAVMARASVSRDAISPRRGAFKEYSIRP